LAQLRLIDTTNLGNRVTGYVKVIVKDSKLLQIAAVVLGVALLEGLVDYICRVQVQAGDALCPNSANRSQRFRKFLAVVSAALIEEQAVHVGVAFAYHLQDGDIGHPGYLEIIKAQNVAFY